MAMNKIVTVSKKTFACINDFLFNSQPQSITLVGLSF